jgi:TP901 family phage tail tape measure protein
MSSGVGAAFSSLEKKLVHAQKKASDIEIGKNLAEDLRKKYRLVKQLEKAIERTHKPSNELKQRFRQARKELAEARVEAKKFDISIENAAQSSKRLGSALKSAKARQQSLNNAMARKESREAMKGQIFDTLALGAAIGAPIKAAIDFESVMADVNKVVDFPSPKVFKEMQKDVLKLSTQIPVSASGFGEIIAAAGQAGIAREELLGFAEDAAKMGVAFDMSAAQAGDAMAGLRSIFQLNQEEVVSLADSFNHLSNSMNARAADLLNISNRAGSTAKLFGLTGQQLGALSATFLDLKTPPEVAGTAINALLLKLATADKQGSKFQDALSEIGLSADEMKAMIEDDAQGALVEFLNAVDGSEDKMGTLSDLFGAEYSDDVAKLVGGLDKYKAALSKVADETKYSGSMEAEYAARSKTTANNLQLLRNQVNRLGINLGSTLLPALNTVLVPIGKTFEGVGTLAQEFPLLTKVVFGTAAGLVVLKASSLGVGFAWSFLKDGAGLLYRGFLLLKPATIATNITMARHRALAIGAAISQKRLAAAAMLSGIKFKALAAAQKIWAVGSAIVTAGTAAISTGFRVMTAAIMSNPIGLIIGGIVLGAVLIVRYWEPIKAFFVKVWDGIKTVFKGGFNVLKTMFFNFTPLGWIIKSFSGIKSFFSGLSLFESGKKLIGTLAGGIKAVITKPFDIVKKGFAKLRNLLPFSDAKEGPLSDLTKSGQKIPETLGKGVDRGEAGFVGRVTGLLKKASNFSPLKSAFGLIKSVVSPETGKEKRSVSGGGIKPAGSQNPVTINITQNFNMSGKEKENIKAAVSGAGDITAAKIKQAVLDILREEKRVSYV